MVFSLDERDFDDISTLSLLYRMYGVIDFSLCCWQCLPFFKEEIGFAHMDKIKRIRKPTLIIHAERDHIIPFSDGEALYEASSATDKRFLKIPNANHNNIFSRGLSEYLDAVKTFVEQIG